MMQQFIKAAQAGDVAAWNFLYRQHYPWMYATALRICGNSPAARDAVQETFITAYLKLPQLKDATAFSGWLKTILLRLCRRSLQPRFIHTGYPASLENNRICDDEISRKMDRYEQLSRTYDSLSCLSDALQSVLLLRYFTSWSSYEEMAAILCIPVGTVRSRLNQAKQKLTGYWSRTDNDNDSAFRKATAWNSLYNDYFGHVYTSLPYREKLIGHFDKDLRLVFSSGKTAVGRCIVQRLIEEDMLYGNCFAGLEVASSGNISIVECRNMNADAYPDRCPDSTVFVLCRSGNVVTQLNLHHAARETRS
jgi:RNA polymerase sigma-70 factor (ECF subfamily)